MFCASLASLQSKRPSPLIGRVRLLHVASSVGWGLFEEALQLSGQELCRCSSLDANLSMGPMLLSENIPAVLDFRW